MSFYDDVTEFHRVFDLPIGDKPYIPDDPAERTLRIELIHDEYRELIRAHVHHDIVEIADALADIIYVACGMAVVYGIPLNEVWTEVQRSNMAKMPPDGHVRYRKDGKVLKPDGWTKPDIRGVLFGDFT